MKKTMKLIVMGLMAGAIFAACGDKGNEPVPDPGETGNYPEDVEIDEMISGPVKAGFADAIEITGSGFIPEDDHIYVGYADGGETKFERISGDVLTLRTGRVSFGLPITASFLDKTIRVYLDRPGYDRMPISGDITFAMPSVAEGYIPDPGFRATLSSIHPQQGNAAIAELFNTYGLLDVSRAATIEEINLYSSNAASLEGIELFKGANRLIAHETTSLEVADLSKWKTSSPIFITMERSVKLKEIIGGPTIGRLDCYDCANLTKIDVSLSRWMYNFQLFSTANGDSAVNYFDIRRQRTGTFKGGPVESATGYTYCSDDNDYTAFLKGAVMRLADNCRILVDYQFLLDKWGGGEGSGYDYIYNAWTRGATIEVYDSQDITKKIGTVPMYADDDDAITQTGDNNWTPSQS